MRLFNVSEEGTISPTDPPCNNVFEEGVVG
jgi:hypothetical protein